MIYGEPGMTNDIDIRSMLAVSGEMLDRDMLEREISTRQLAGPWRAIHPG